MISQNHNVSLGNVDCTYYTHRVAPKDDYHRKTLDMLACTPAEVNYMETLAKTSTFPAGQKQFIEGIVFSKAPVRRIAIAMNTTSAFTGTYTGNFFWYRQLDLRQTRILKGGQS